MKKELTDMLSWAITHVPYYINIACTENLDPCNISSFPIVNKDLYLRNPNEFVSNDIDTNHLQTSATSGTTGMPLKVVKTRSDYYTQLKNLWMKRSSMHGVKPLCTYINIGIFNNSPEISHLSENGKCMNINASMVTEEWFAKAKENIENMQPEYVLSYTSGLLKFLSLYEASSTRLPPSIKVIELIGEPMLDFQRKIIESFTQALIIQNYSATELLGIAISCQYGHMHCIDENALLEIFDGDRKCGYDEEGEIIITSVYSKAMPFIRYKIGDFGKIIKQSVCPCQNQGDIIQITKGRTVDFLELYNGKSLHSIILFSAIEDTSFLLRNCIYSFKVVQQSNRMIEINLCFKKGYEKYFKPFQMVFQKKIKAIIDDKNIEWVFRTYSYLDERNEGKIKLFARKD
mgnify:CR=1 FL=1|jgi:phenylacetate-CoA ligase